MEVYYLNNNKQVSNGSNYELHKNTCHYFLEYNNGNNFDYIGPFSSDEVALAVSKNMFPEKANKIDGCKHCCPNIHKE